MSHPARFAALSNTPISIRSAALTKLETIVASNPDAGAAAYVKLYASATTPTGSTAPIFSARIAAGQCLTLPVFVEMSHLWIAAATEAGAGLSAPATAFEVSVTYG